MERDVEIIDRSKLLDCNIIVLGGSESIGWIGKIYSQLGLGIEQFANRDTRRISIKTDIDEVFLTDEDENSLKNDHAIVMRFINQQSGLTLFSVSGGRGQGTAAAVLALTKSLLFTSDGFTPNDGINITVISVNNVAESKIYKHDIPQIKFRRWLYKMPTSEIIESTKNSVKTRR